jgi:hypothetical protein
VRVLEMTEILSFGRVGGSDLSRFDLQLRLTESAAAEELLIYAQECEQCARHGCNPCQLVGSLTRRAFLCQDQRILLLREC